MICNFVTSAVRIFPSPSEATALSPSPWFNGQVSPFRWFKSRSPESKLRDFFWLYRQALLAESKRHTSRADFYWKEAHLQAKRLARNPKYLEGAFKSFAIANHIVVPESVLDITRRFIGETLIDGHIAAYNALESLSDVNARERWRYHIGQIAKLLKSTKVTPAEKLSILRPAIEKIAATAVEGKFWSTAVEIYQTGLSVDPADSELLNKLVEALSYQVLVGLKPDSAGDEALCEAKKLKASLSEIEKFAMTKPFDQSRFDFLVRLYQALAVRLANGTELAEALEAIEKAYVISPSDHSVAAIKSRLSVLMEDFKRQFAQVEESIRNSYNKQLSAEGYRFKAQAMLGFKLAHSFASSKRATEFREAVKEASNQRFRTALALSEADDIKLINFELARILEAGPKSVEEIESKWQQVVIREPELARIDRNKVIAFLAHLCLGTLFQETVREKGDLPPPIFAPQIELLKDSGQEEKISIGQWFLSLQHTLFRRVSIVGSVVLVIAAIGFSVIMTLRTVEWHILHKIYGPAAAYEPDIPHNPTNDTWIAFRLAHPYPYQGFGAKKLPDGSCVLVISEPPPSLSKDKLDEILKIAFNGSTVSSERQRWNLGADGWVEDVVLQLAPGSVAADNPMDDAGFRDRVSIVQMALFGTSYGAEVENLGATTVVPRVAANLTIRPNDIKAWLADTTLLWHPLIDQAGAGQNWDQISKSSQTRTLQSQDGSLIMLTFPTRLLAAAKTQTDAFTSLRVPFREFAVASDGVIAGVWSHLGQVAILGRVRQTPLSIVPPLRFETFSLLADQSANELSQSYERNSLFAGKIDGGENDNRDWAPAYLSAPLVNTELGALLGVTDQMLKSWTEEGQVQYLYFNYAKPKKSPFGGQRLRDILTQKFHSTGVLYNWNTAGSAVVVRGGHFSTITVNQTGALPVTYGADGKTHAEGGADVLTYEDQAYNYFASLKDPCLQRVAQYTLLYQIFRAVATDPSTTHPLVAAGTDPTEISESPEQSDSDEMEMTYAEHLIDFILTAANDSSEQAFIQDLGKKLESALANQPELINKELIAQVLIDGRSAAAHKYYLEIAKKEAEAWKDLERRNDAYEQHVKEFNKKVTAQSFASDADYQSGKGALDLEEAQLKKLSSSLENKEWDPLSTLAQSIQAVAQEEFSIDEIRTKYTECNSAQPEGAIKTPSIVLSWDSRDFVSETGGHDLNAHAVRFEPSSTVSTPTKEVDKNGYTIIQYNPDKSPAVEENAPEIARAIEHGGMDIKDIGTIASQHAVQSRAVALQLTDATKYQEPEFDAVGRIGERVYTDKQPFVDDLRAIGEKNPDLIFVARDHEHVAYMTEENLAPPPAVRVMEIRDTPSLIEQLSLATKGRAKNGRKSVIFLDENEDHVNALKLALSDDDVSRFNQLASELGAHPSSKAGIVSGVMGADLKGRPSILRGITDTATNWFRDVMGLSAKPYPKASWSRAVVSEMDSGSVASLVEKADWNTGRDGVPTAIKISFEQSPLPGQEEIDVVAGFSDTPEAAARAMLKSAHDEVVSVVPEHGASLAEYFMTLRNDLRSHPNAKLKRLVLVIHDQQSKVLFTLVLTPPETNKDT